MKLCETCKNYKMDETGGTAMTCQLFRRNLPPIEDGVSYYVTEGDQHNYPLSPPIVGPKFGCIHHRE